MASHIYNYHFKLCSVFGRNIVLLTFKELAEEFNSQFQCLEENTEKRINFPIPLQKENKSGNTATHKINFIESVIFMATSLSSLASNLADGL